MARRSHAAGGTHDDATAGGEPAATPTDASVAICPHLSLEHYRGGEKWAAALANRLADDGVDVAVHALPYAPGGERRVDAADVLDDRVPYREAWRHDLSGYETAYVFYMPFAGLCFRHAPYTVAGIHSWAFVTDQMFESHYGAVPTAVKALYRVVGRRDLRQFDEVHTVTPAFDSPHPNTTYVPNFVDTDRFHPDRAPLAEEFTVLATAAHIPEKGWDTVREVAARLPDGITLAATGTSDDPHVEALGFLDEPDLAAAYARAHVVLHPARVDTDSMVLNEACASGTPAITTPLPTHVRENEAVVHCRTPDEMVETIRGLRREWAERAGYDHRCRTARAAAESRSVDSVYARLRSLLLSPHQ